MLSEQERIIKLLEVYLDNACKNGRQVLSYIPGVVAMELYDRLKPHLQKPFDREAVTELATALCDDCPNIGPDDFTNGVERLYSGESETSMPSEEQATLRAMATKLQTSASKERLSKPVCTTCEGSGEVPGGFHQLDTVPCPDCKPVCLRCGVE